jgi:hypothetical protein
VSESDLYGQLMIEATRLGHRLFRNQVGRARYKSARGDVFTVPYGVGGVGGSDLIGWSFAWFDDGRVSTPAEKVAIFTAIEVKQKGKKATKEQAQFLEAVRAAGGIAGVCTSISDYHKLIGYTE